MSQAYAAVVMLMVAVLRRYSKDRVRRATLDGQGPITIRIKEHELLVTNEVSSDADKKRVVARLSW